MMRPEQFRLCKDLFRRAVCDHMTLIHHVDHICIDRHNINVVGG